ncbi:sorting nexin-19 [Amia ocellicauda]|uniref:sorting nexin-19 n=1 Tax=Amia ocellicauda TaxID=2972642 RepID=UPI003463A1DB|nr:SNX19 protein [Amia calva]
MRRAMTQAEAIRPNSWLLFFDLMGQKKLLGFGVLLVWMMVFHLLVNVWLLCVFTCLLVILGGWLGSQAVLDTNSVVHLERFIRLDRTPHSPESELQLDEEISSTVSKIIRDFVSSWYRTVTSEPEFEIEVQKAMLSMALQLKSRAQKVDRKALAQRTLELCGCHLQSYMRAKEVIAELEKQPGGDNRYAEGNLWKLYCKVSNPHPALKSSAMEVNYARAIVDLLLHVLVPPPHLETRTGRYVVGELITCNVLLPLITKMSDPDWLNLMIVDVFTKSSKQGADRSDQLAPSSAVPPVPPVQQQQQQHAEQNNLEIPSSLPLKIQLETPSVSGAPTPELTAYDVIEHSEISSQQETEEEECKQDGSVSIFSAAKTPGIVAMDYLRPETFNPFYCEDSDLESPLSDLRKGSTESLLPTGAEETLSEQLGDGVIGSLLDPDEEFQSDTGLGDDCQKTFVPHGSEQTSASQASAVLIAAETPGGRPTSIGDLGSVTSQEVDKDGTRAEQVPSNSEQAGDCNPHELSIVVPLRTSSPTTGVISLATFSFEPLSSPDGPVMIQNLRITGTITAKEHRGTGSHPYTLYTVKYETAVDTENPGTLQSVAYHMVNRRYSEFLNLQTRLEEKPELRKLIKNVKGPKKLFPDLPFGNMDSDKVEARKGLLESFLKQLCAIPEAANSEEMQEFLALNTDARIAFVKKPFIVSRIDKIVMNAIADTLKTAFPRSQPQSPTEDNGETDADGKPSDNKKSKSRLRFSSKIAPVLSVSDIQPKVLYCFGEEQTVFSGLSLAGLEDFLQKQEKQLSLLPAVETGDKREGETENRSSEDPSVPDRGLQEEANRNAGAEMALADIALNILCLLMKNQWSWLCTQNIQKTIRLLFGTLIDRWLDVHIANLTCTQYWVIYLRVLQEAIWPGGSLPAQPRPARTAQQKEEAREQSLQCLMRLLPDIVPDMLGSEKYKLSWQVILESLQDPYINRHLVYCVWDLLLEFLVPESSDEDFQKSLLDHVSGNTE